MNTTKRIVTASTLIGALIAPGAVLAQETLYVAGTGGSNQQTMEEHIIPAFEAKTGAKVVYVPASSTDTLAKLIAQKGNQDVSLMLIDSGVMRQAIAQDLCTAIPAMPVLDDLYPNARMQDDKAVGYGFYATGLGYNKQVFEQNGWAAPTSWNDLADPKFKGKVSMGPISGYGIEALVMLAHANGGSETNIEPGFEAMAKVAENVLAWEASQATLAQMFQTGEAALVVWGNIRVQPVIDQGAPVAFVYPKEGALQAMGAACLVNGAPQPELARQFLEDLLAPAAQSQIAEFSAWGPANTKTELAPEIASKVVYGPEQVNALVAVDWTAINEQRPEWTQRWNREIER